MRLHAAPLALCVASLLTIVLAVSGCDKNLPDTGGALPGVAVHRDSDAVVAAAVETALRSNEDFRQLDIAVATRKGTCASPVPSAALSSTRRLSSSPAPLPASTVFMTI